MLRASNIYSCFPENKNLTFYKIAKQILVNFFTLCLIVRFVMYCIPVQGITVFLTIFSKIQIFFNNRLSTLLINKNCQNNYWAWSYMTGHNLSKTHELSHFRSRASSRNDHINRNKPGMSRKKNKKIIYFKSKIENMSFMRYFTWIMRKIYLGLTN